MAGSLASVWRRAVLLARFAASALLVSACSREGGALDAVAGVKVEEFHRAYNAGNYREIYRSSAPVFREMAPETTFVGFLAKARARLGPAVDAQFVESTQVTGTGGVRLTSRYRTRFEGATATELFVFVEVEGKPVLAGYTIDAPVSIQ
jgi:hypothetical protein